MNTKVREEFGLHWLYNKFEESAGLLPFPDEAVRVLHRLIAEKEMRSCTFTAATSSRRLVEHWLDVRKLPMRHNGVKIDQQMSGTPAGGELDDYISLSDGIDGQTSVLREDLVRLMQEEGMTVPPFLLPEVVESAAQKAFKEWLGSDDSNERSSDPVYMEAWALFEERDLWANMQHHNDPDKFEKIRANRSRVEDALAKLLPRTEVQLPPGAEIAGKSVTKQQALIAFGGLVGKESTLKKAMENSLVWVTPARVSRGGRGRGKGVSSWNPVVLAVALHERKMATTPQLDRAFSKHAFLAPWREEWAEQAEDIRV